MIARVLHIAIFVLSAISSFSQKHKDTLNIKEVIINAKYILEEAGLNKTTVDTIILQKAINLSLANVLSENTSVFVKSNGRGAMSTVSFRGTSASHTNVLWNGINIKDPMLGQVDFSLIPVFFIDNLSLSNGASSINELSGALGGSINIENKPNWNNKFSAKITQGIGSYYTFNEFAKINFGSNNFQSKTRVFYTYSKNNFKFLNKNIASINEQTGEYIYPEQRNENADYKMYGFLQELYFKKDSKNFLSLKFWSQWNNRSLPNLNTYEGDVFSNINKQTDDTHRLVADWKYYANKKVSLIIRSSVSIKSLNYYLKNFISGNNYVNAIYSTSQSKTFISNFHFKYKINKKTIVNAKYDLDYNVVFTEDTVKKTGYEKQRLKHSLFLSVHRKISNRLSSSLLLRQDVFDNKFSPFIPSLGLDFVISKKNNLILKANLAKNYNQPSLNDLYWQPGGNIKLKPESGLMSELSLTANKKISLFTLSSSLTGFYSDINNWIIWLPSPKAYWVPENIKRVKTSGIESYLKTNAKVGGFKFNLKLSYALTKSINLGNKDKWGDASYGKQLPYVPVHSGNIFFNIAYNNFSISYLHNSYSERFTSSTNDITKRDWLYPYFMNNLFLGKDFKFKNTILGINFKIYNLFNERYRTVLGRAMPKRNYLLLVSFKF